MDLKDKVIGFAMTGSFCTFAKALAEMEKVANEGAKLVPIMSSAAFSTDTRFGKAAEINSRIEKLCGRGIINTVCEAEPIGPKGYLDLLIIAPCTGNSLAKLAAGIADTAVTMAAKAHLRNQKPVLIAVSTNEPVIIVLSRENLVKSRASVLSTNFLLFRASTISFKSQNIIMEGCAYHVKNNRSMQ